MNIKKMRNQLMNLNSLSSSMIEISSKKIRTRVKPDVLTYPKGYYFDGLAITNAGNVPFWRKRTFNVLYVKHKRM